MKSPKKVISVLNSRSLFFALLVVFLVIAFQSRHYVHDRTAKPVTLIRDEQPEYSVKQAHKLDNFIGFQIKKIERIQDYKRDLKELFHTTEE